MARNRTRTTPAPAPTPEPEAEVVSVFYDLDGEVVTEDEIPDAYRDAFNHDNGEESCTLEDEQIDATVTAVIGDEKVDATVRPTRMAKLLEANGKDTLPDLTTPVASNPTSMGAVARKIGESFSVNTDKVLNEYADDVERVNGKPLILAFAFAKDLGGDFDEDGYPTNVKRVTELPVPNSNEKHRPAGSNKPCDRYKWKDNNGTEHSGHVMADIVRSTPYGKVLDTLITDLETIGSSTGYDPKSVVNKENDPKRGLVNLLTDDIKGDKAGCRTSLLARYKKRRSSRITAAGKAIAWLQVVTALDDRFPKLTYEFTSGAGPDKLADTAVLNRPLRIVSATKGRGQSATTPLSLTQFNSLQLPGRDGRIRLDAIAQAGGSVAAVTDAFKRKKKGDGKNDQGGDQDKTGKSTAIPTPEQVESHMNMMVTGLDADVPSKERSKDAELYLAKLRIYYNHEGKDADERLLTLNDYVEALIEFRSMYSQRIGRIVGEQSKAREDAAKDKTKAA